MADPWDIPPPPQFGDATVEEPALARNRALNTWEAMEDGLAALCTQLQASGPTYGAGVTFVMRVSNLEKAACVYFVTHPSQETEGELRSLLAYARKMADRRNDIAHGMVIPYTTFPANNVSELPPTATRFALCPSKYDIKRQRFAYSGVQIEKFALMFSLMLYEIQEFTSRLV